MEPEEETKPCTNCKREIPASNMTVHALFCARNISACPTCKEPVPNAQMQEHHDKLHKLVPCKQCGESVRGTDLEDHVRDSCANTTKTCRFCELELPRRSLPAHEWFCGARTERCADCHEYVMLKYRALHLDSNHGFIRMDDDPIPDKKESKPLRPTSSSAKPPNSNTGPKTEIRYFQNGAGFSGQSTTNDNGPSTSGNRTESTANGAIAKTVDKNEVKASRGAVKKRPAPPPPRPPPPHPRDLPYHRAVLRAQQEEKQRREQSAANLAAGLPPVLNAAEKLEKLRKMDALTHRETQPVDYKDKLRGRVWMPVDVPTGNVLGNAPTSPEQVIENNKEKKKEKLKTKNKNRQRSPNTEERTIVDNEEELEQRRREFKNLKPMTPEEFMNRFNDLQLGRGARGEGRGAGGGSEGRGAGGGSDRFSEIKSSLRELRRGLNEVTAPYNANVQGNQVAMPPPAPASEDVRIPCEFCGELIHVDDIVIHQTGCRPDLAQLRAAPAPAAAPAPRSPRPRPRPRPRSSEPVIPCEFCMESLPVYLINEHQERCGREANLLYPD